MTTRTRVTEAELKRLFFSEAGAALIHDYHTETKAVRLSDGSEYETPFDELTGE